jgi:insulin receptor
LLILKILLINLILNFQTITWEKPKQINGKFDKYILKLKTEEFSDILFTSERDYCSHPIEHWELEEEKKTSKEDTTISKDPNLSQTCDCKESCRKVCDEIDKDDGTTRENAIFFENQIQDFVWKKQEDMKPIAVENFNNRKAKRQADIFPGSSADKETVKIKKDPLDESDETMTLNSYGEYENIRIPINNETNTSITITNLRHFTRYQVHIHVCRQLDESEDPNMNIELCSDPTVEFIRTSKDEGKDDITWFQVEEIASNVSAYGALKVSWIIPKRPNGAVTAYNFRYKRNDAEHSKATDKCINEDQFRRLYFNKNENKGTYIIKQVNPGNYSVQLWASSLAGSPQVTANFPVPKYVLISEKSESDYTLHILIGVLIILVMFVCAALFIINKRNQNISRNLKLIANVNPDYAGVDYQLDDWEIPRDRIILLHELGQGSFGMVYEGIVKDLVRRSGDEKIEGETPCAVKTVNENATDRERSSFLSEATVMKQFDTAFVVKLLGVVSVSQPTYVVMELMPNGDLKGYLRLHRAEYNDDTPQPPPQPPTIRQMLQMSAEIADGMSYLAAKKFVHRDLAARNCMVAADLTVKIGDFGMTRDIYETDYYR